MYTHCLLHFLAILSWLLTVGGSLPSDPAPQKASHFRLSKHSALGLLARSAPALGPLGGLLPKLLFFTHVILALGKKGGKKWMQYLNGFNKALNRRQQKILSTYWLHYSLKSPFLSFWFSLLSGYTADLCPSCCLPVSPHLYWIAPIFQLSVCVVAKDT